MDQTVIEMQKQECLEYFYKLADKLRETHEIIPSCNNDCSMYLIPKGSIADLSYTSKPSDSYRFSDHWNWYENLNKCEDPHYIQCYNVDMPWAFKRKEEGMASKPIMGCAVAYFDQDKKYHTIFGRTFDRKNKTWSWREGI